jgi:ABC-2 type transport system permease protein
MTVFLLASIQITVMMIFSYFALKVKWRDINSIVALSFSTVFAVAGLGVFIASLTYRTENYRIANMFENIIVQVMALLGGNFFPIDVMPKLIQKLSFFSLNGVALNSYLKIILGYGLADILNNVLILSAIGVLFTVMGVVIFNKEVSDDAKHNKIKTAKA